MTDFRGGDDEEPFVDATVRMTVPASIGGRYIRLELSNRFGDEPVLIGRGAIRVGERSHDVVFDTHRSCVIPVGGSRRSDWVEAPVAQGDDVEVDLYLPGPAPYATANGFTFQRLSGNVAGSSDPAAARRGPPPDESGWSLPAGGPFLRAVEVAGAQARAVVVCLGASVTTMGWPQLAAALLPPEAGIAVLNRGIPGNRIRFDAPAAHRSWGRSGLARFEEDVVDTPGVTHVILAHASNDIGLPGRDAPLGELPTAAQQVDAYERLIGRARDADVATILATITPMAPEHAGDPTRERIRVDVNTWIRGSGYPVVDFDEVLRSSDDPSRISPIWDVGDHQHPNLAGQKRLAQAVAHALADLRGH